METVYRIKGTYKPTGKRVFLTTRKFKDLTEAKEYTKYVIGNRRFKGIRYIKI